jgi:hypothetical protein
MIEKYLTRFLDNPHRRLFLISATFGIAVLILLPLADKYLAQMKKREQLALLLEDSQRVAAALDQYQTRADEAEALLAAAETRTVGPDELNAFRGTVVRMARDSRCQVRRINVGGVNVRRWKGPDSLQLGAAAESVAVGNDFTLTTQTLSLQVTGRLSDVKLMLGKLRDEGVVMHTKSFALRPNDSQRDEIILDMDLVLYSLQRTARPTA